MNWLKTFDISLKAYSDLNAFEFYFNDIGLLLSIYEQNVIYDIINGNFCVFKGGIFENAIAQCLIDNELPIYYYQEDEHVEIDFVTYMKGTIAPIEVKSSKNIKVSSLRTILEKESMDYGIVISTNNVNCSNPKIRYYSLWLCF